MFEQLGDNIARAIQQIQGRNKITELNIASTVKEIRRALLQADVGYKVANDLTKKIKEEALGRRVLTTVSPGKLFTAITCEALTKLMGEKEEPLKITGNPSVILLAGLQGTGKTTLAAKLAFHIKKQGMQPLLASCDVHRPAAIMQLQVMGERAGVDVYADAQQKDPLVLARGSLACAREQNKKVLIMDTAGRLAVDATMMKELADIQRILQPQETLLVVDAMTGQDAVVLAQRFREYVRYNGVVLTKLDGDTRGGAALSLRAVVEVPIKFISYGEKIETLDIFHPDRMARRILNMGDVVSLVERAQEAFDEQAMRALAKKVQKNTFDLNDFSYQIQQVKKMGSLKEVLSMMPVANSMKQQINKQANDEIFRRMEVVISSMTPKERRQPDVIDAKRRRRIALGSGTDLKVVDDLLKRYDMARKMMKKGIGKSMKKAFFPG